MKIIWLTQGQFTLVDESDYEYLKDKKWQAHKSKYGGYYAISNIKISKNKWKSIKMHRIILGLDDPKILGEHEDMNGLNNQRYNLRIANKSQNGANRKAKPGCTSPYLGVSWYKKNKCWRVNIQKNKIITHLGYFTSEIDAAKAYNKRAIELHGEFARLNIIVENGRI